MKKKIIYLILIVSLISISIYGLKNKEKININSKLYEKVQVEEVDETEKLEKGDLGYSLPDKYYIDEDILESIEPFNMDMYKKVYDAVDNIEREVDISEFDPTEDDINKLRAAIGDRSQYELFYYKGSELSESDGLFKIYYFDKSVEQIKKEKKQFKEEINRILSEIIRPEYSDLEKELIIYRYVTENTDYNHESLQTSNFETGNMSSIIFNNKGVCYGYASLMKYLLNSVGIEAHVAKTLSHSWNVVKIDGEYYNLDATGIKTDTLGYFNFNDEEMFNCWKVNKNDVYFGDANYKKMKAIEATDDKFEFLRDTVFYYYDVEDKYIYYSNHMDSYTLYKAKLDGSNIEKISDVGIANLITYKDTVYYSDMNNGFSLYRMKKDGTEIELVDDSIETYDFSIKGNTLYYGNKRTDNIKELDLDKIK